MAAPDDPAGRARHDEIDRRIRRSRKRHLAAIRVHDDGRSLEAGRVEAVAHRAHLAADDRLEIGIGERRRGPLVFLHFGRTS